LGPSLPFGEKQMRKVIALILATSSFTLFLGYNCIPNVPDVGGPIESFLAGLGFGDVTTAE